MKKAIVIGAGGFIGGHLVTKLKELGYWVRGVDLKYHEYKETDANEFIVADMRDPLLVDKVITDDLDEVYQLAADKPDKDSEVAQHLRDHALFIAFAPVQAPRIAIAVVVEHGGAGSTAAAPVARATLDAWLDQEIGQELPP